MSTSELADLARRAQAGDADALSDLLSQFQNMVYYTALKLLGNAHDAEDASQEVYVKVLESLPQLREAKAVLRWVVTITQNVCKNHLKTQGSRVFVDDGEALLGDLPEDTDDLVPDRYMDMAAKREIILGMIDALPEKQRLTVYLYYYNGNTVKEIAQYMEVSEGTVKSRLAAARANLQAQVEDEARKGNKLYVIFPFLGKLLQEDAQRVKLPPLGVTEAQIAAVAAGYAAAAVGAHAAAEVTERAGKAAKAAKTADEAKKAAAVVAKSAAGKAGAGLGVKIAAGIVAAAVLIGGVVFLSGALGGGEEAASQPTPSAVTAQPSPTPTPSPTPSPEPSAGVDLSDFDPLAALGQPLSAMTDILGEPTGSDNFGGGTSYHWQDAEETYSIDVTMTSDDSMIRSIGVIKGAPVLGVNFGDSAEAAQQALAGIAGAQGVDARDAGGGMIIYSAITPDNRYIYQFPCAPEGFVTCGAVEDMTLPL